MNPFDENPRKMDDTFMDWTALYAQPYNKHSVDPYTRTRVILMNGTEFEANWFSHQFSRHCADNELRRQVALLRRGEQQQQKLISMLKPADETILEHTIGYEQLAVDLTAGLAQMVGDQYVKKALDFALLEDFDHLYRYADLLDMEAGVQAENLVGRYTEIMPGRPTIAHHRHPYDSIKKPIGKNADPMTKLAVGIITAAEQQTMNYYMNIAAFYKSDRGRKLYQEIGMIEEQHVTQYGALLDTKCTWLESLLMHEYTECYLYWSCFNDETDRPVKKIWEQHFHQELSHLHAAARLLQTYEKKEWRQVIPDGEFPELLKFGPQKEYIRDVLAGTVEWTADGEEFTDVRTLPADFRFFNYQRTVNARTAQVPSHAVIEDYLAEYGRDYRYEDAPHPVKALQDREKDNTRVGRTRSCTK